MKQTHHSKKTKLILLRHGESIWNQRNLFTGWVDVPLSEKGIQEALKAGEKIQDIPIDVIFMSSLVRSHMTMFLAMINHYSKKVPIVQHPHQGNLENWAKINSEEAQEQSIPVYMAWQLNERMYGDLQGLNKQALREKYGEEKVHEWRRSFRSNPPNGESLAMTAERTLPYFDQEIVPYLKKGKNVFISAHGNSLRSIVMELNKLSEEAVCKLEIATGDPLIYEYEDSKWRRVT
jgi:2,3-bisphosphoglycerate-dependent phosphoglycerate mutase